MGASRHAGRSASGGKFSKTHRSLGPGIPDDELRRLLNVLDGKADPALPGSDLRDTPPPPGPRVQQPDAVHWPQWARDWLGEPPEYLLVPTSVEVDAAADSLVTGVADPAVLGPQWLRAHGAPGLDLLMQTWKARL